MQKRIRGLAAALCLLLALTACGSPASNGGNGGSAKLPSAERPADSTEPPAKTEPDQPDAPTAPAQYDDRLITEAAALDIDFQNEYGEACRASVHLPQLTSPGASALNRRILDCWGDLAEKTPEDFARECLAVTVNWESHWSGSLLSLVVTEEQPGFGPVYQVFHYDFAQEREWDAGELLDRLGIPEDALRTALCRAAAGSFDSIFSDGRAGAPKELALCRAKTLAAAADAVYAPSFYPNADGSLTAYLDICTPVAAGWSAWEVRVPLVRQAASLRAEAGGITAAVHADGTVEVCFESGSAYEAQQAAYGFVCGTRYSIDGCYGTYKKLLIAPVGVDDAPCLFLLTELGAVEYVRLLDAFRFGVLVSHGPLYGVGVAEGLWGDPPQAEDLEAGAGERISTVYAVMSDGSRYDLAERFNTGGTLQPYDLAGSWEAAVTLPGGSVTEYSMQILPGGSLPALTFTERVPAQEISVTCDGALEYLGMNDAGLLYGYTAVGPDGSALTGTMALLPQEDTLLASSAGGDALFDAPEGLQFVRSFG